MVFLGGEKFHPSQINEQQWRDLYHHFVDITSGDRKQLVSVLDEPVERERFRKALEEQRPFRPLGCPSTFANSAQIISEVLTKLKNDEPLTADERGLILSNVPTREYNPQVRVSTIKLT